MSEFNLSKKVRLTEHNAYGDKVIPLEDVKEFIRLLKEPLKLQIKAIDKEEENSINKTIRAFCDIRLRTIDKLAGSKLT